MEDENPFLEDENQVATRVGYLYKVWKIAEANPETGTPELKICIRCSVHLNAESTDTEELSGEAKKSFMNVYALNEHNPNKTQWRQNIDTSIINILNKSIADNSFKVSRWLVQSLLADADFIKFAFVSRKQPTSNKKHVVLATHTVKTKSWAKQLNMTLDTMWNNIKHLVEIVQQKDLEEKTKIEAEGGSPPEMSEYILLKDFNKLAFRLYKKEMDMEDEGDEEDEA